MRRVINVRVRDKTAKNREDVNSRVNLKRTETRKKIEITNLKMKTALKRKKNEKTVICLSRKNSQIPQN